MKRILGLDLGISSIGWAFIHEGITDREASKIIKTGVYIINLTTNEKDEFSQGKTISTNAIRTQNRGARRNTQRFKQRRDHLLKILIELDFISSEEDLKTDKSIELYKNRALAVEQKIDKRELAKVFFLLNGKRGYKSNRKTKDENNKSDYLSEISARDEELLERDITIGQKFYELLQMNPLARLKDRIYSRHSYIEEFDLIWKEQSKHYTELTDSLYNLIKEEIIFYQRDLKSQKWLLSECEFEKHHKVIPVSSPLFQEFRIWLRLNDIIIKDRYSVEYTLTQDQKVHLFEKLQEVEKLTDKQVLRELGLKHSMYNLNFDKIEGNSTKAELLKILSDTDFEYDLTDILDLDTSLTKDDFDKQPSMQLWHLLYSAKSTDRLVENLKTKFSFNETQAKAIANRVNYELRYGSLSARAIRKILPYLEQGYNYSEACEKAGLRHSNWISKEEKENWEPKELKHLQKNSLRNPVVEKIINQLINLVNAMLEDPELGRPDEIRIEMARELRMNTNRRKALTKVINDSTKRYKAIREKLKEEFNISRPSRNDVIKYRLAEETDWISLYSGKPIQPSKLFTEDYDIEHIIPKARLFDDSFHNKTLCESNLNREKSNRTAFDYMSSKGKDNLNSFLALVKDNKKMKRAKKDKLLMTSDKIPNDFINRQLNETQYIAKKAKEIMSSVAKEVTTTSGSITDLLRFQWELPYIIQDLNLDKYRSINQTEIREIKTNGNSKKQIEQIFHLDKSGNKTFWNKRDDHRHHALDAIVVALTKQSHIQHLNTLNASFEERYNNSVDKLKIAAQRFDLPWKSLREDVKTALESILVSYKKKNKVVTKNTNKIKTKNGIKRQKTLTPRGELHKEMVYGKIKTINTTPIKLDKKFQLEYIDLIVNKQIRNLVKSHLEKFENNPNIAFDTKTLKSHPLLIGSKSINEVTCYKETFVIRKPIDENLKIEEVIDKGIQDILKKRLDVFSGNKKLAFTNLEENPIFLDKNESIEIKRVRIKTKHISLEQLERGYVDTGKNHHVAIYEDHKGKKHGEKVSFFEAVERKKQGVPLIKTQHEMGWKYLLNLQINDYFVFFDNEVTPETDLLNFDNYSIISKNIYVVQNTSVSEKGAPNFEFKHHLETSKNNKYHFSYKRFQSYDRLIGNCQKVQINNLGAIIKIGEY